MRYHVAVCLTLLASLTAVVFPADAAEWGTIKGRFVVTGAVRALEPVVPTKDQFCIASPPPNEEILVGPNQGLANVVVFLMPARDETIEVHPDYESKLREPVILDNKACRFEPHIALLRTGQQLVIKNSDPILHNTKAFLRNNGEFNESLQPGGENLKTFAMEEMSPMPVQCNIHPFMRAHVVVRSNPYMAASLPDGTFEIVNVPSGEHEFYFWHEARGHLRDVQVGTVTSNQRGRARLTIPAGGTLDVGDIAVPGSSF